jgi:hypothetical protein
MSTMDREEGDRFEFHKPERRPGEAPDTEESPEEGGGSEGAADIGARGTAEGGTYGEDDEA